MTLQKINLASFSTNTEEYIKHYYLTKYLNNYHLVDRLDELKEYIKEIEILTNDYNCVY